MIARQRAAALLSALGALFAAPTYAAAQAVVEKGVMESVDAVAGRFNAILEAVFFYDLAFWTDAYRIPLVVFWLCAGALFFTFYFRFISIRGFKHAIDCVSGRYSSPDDEGEVSHFQALATALSATVGLGNIAGVAIAISIGGPGAMFWMMVAGFLGMSTKFTECTLAQQYRQVRSDGRLMGGAMEYLSRGLAEKGWPKLGTVLAVLFCILCIGGSLGGGNSFQVNQSMNAVSETFPIFATHSWIYGLIMVVLVGIVIIGGIRRIANVAEKLVPLMALIYVAMALFILLSNFDR